MSKKHSNKNGDLSNELDVKPKGVRARPDEIRSRRAQSGNDDHGREIRLKRAETGHERGCKQHETGKGSNLLDA